MKSETYQDCYLYEGFCLNFLLEVRILTFKIYVNVQILATMVQQQLLSQEEVLEKREVYVSF